MNKDLLEKYNRLIEYIKDLDSVAVAFSSGVDSTFLLYAAKDALKDKALAVTVKSIVLPKDELDESVSFCRDLGLEQVVVDVDVLAIPEFRNNIPKRCYYCKKNIFSHIIDSAKDRGIKYVLEGSNIDDDLDYRPGKIAIEELGVLSPLKEVGLSKQEIRDLSKFFKLPTFDKPSMACLASRIAYNQEITSQILDRVEKGEKYLRDLGFEQCRLRVRGNQASIELELEQIDSFIDKHEDKAIKYIKTLGFDQVLIDKKGYRTGSMNEDIK